MLAETATYRLPRSVVPQRYELELSPDLASAVFTGTAAVDIDVLEPVNEIVLNAADLTISSARLAVAGGPDRHGSVTLDAAEQRATITFDAPVAPASGYRLEMAFTGILNDKLHGFYRSTFTAEDGAEQPIATTQFEPADARRAFPCWDEPDFKARFAVTLVVEAGLTAISNGAAASEVATEDGRRRVTFAETMPMSTYLVAFVVGPFELTAPLDVDGTPLRVAAVAGKAALTSYAVEAGAYALSFLARYFDIAYPADKIDHLAIPDFAFGAMENLGCVTYRETALLIDVDAASQLELQRIATVVAHETAHMWFGDLVTMKWWNGIWLNEAFATFMELTTTNAFRPDWDVWTAFGAGKAAAMATDGLRTTRPVEFAVGRPGEAEAMFDVLTYQKGGAVLRMLEQYLGPEVFRTGIARYLASHQYGNTETTDLWDAIEATSGEPVRTTMDTWIFQGGYPLISVEADAGGRRVTLSQRRFVYSGDPGDARWVVPINLRASVGGAIEHRRLLLTEERTSLEFRGDLDWLVVNDGAWGFYRVRYEPELRRRLTDRMGSVLNPLERMSLVVDTWAAVLAGVLPLSEFTDLVIALGDEEDPDVWSAALAPLGLLDLVVAEEDRPVLQDFVRRAAQPTFTRLGWDPQPGEPPRSGLVRSRLINALGNLGADPDVRGEAQIRFERYLTDRPSLVPDVVNATVTVAGATGGEPAYETLLTQFRQATTPQDKVRYLYALAASEDVTLLERTLELCLSSEVRSQDAPFLIGSVMGSRAGGRLGWDWVESRWDDLASRFPQNMLIRMLEGVTALVQPDLAERVHAFLASHDIPSGGRRLSQLAERMDINAAFGQRVRGELASTLRGESGD